ncbi:MAG: amidohydrolase family protein, partial [Lachnospiraceae bacterium]|nr:amidohydrolase family protein [Lachnospiraceae bacterium]
LIEWLNTQTFPEEAKYADAEYAKKAYAIFVENMRKSATTRACIFGTIHRKATEILMDLMEESGLVSYVGKVNMDRSAPESLTEESADMSAFSTFGWINDIRERYLYTRPILTLRFIPSCTDELMEQLREVQRTYQLPVQSHLSENQGEIEWVKQLRPDAAFYGDGYDKYDLFGDRNLDQEKVRTVMAHCVWSTDDEVRRIKDNGVFIAHCPASNMNLSSGIAPIRKYLDLDMKVGLGSDVAGGQTESIFRAITDAIQVSKMYWRHVDEKAKPVTLEEAFYMATKGGGEFFGKVGSFETGYEFDALVLDDSALKSPNDLNIRQRIERAIYLSLDLNGIVAKYAAGRKIC